MVFGFSCVFGFTLRFAAALALPASSWVAGGLGSPGGERIVRGAGGRLGPRARRSWPPARGGFRGWILGKQCRFGLLLILPDYYNLKTNDPTTEVRERTETFWERIFSAFSGWPIPAGRGTAAPGSRSPVFSPRDSRSCGLPHGGACPRGPTAWAQRAGRAEITDHAKLRRSAG